MTSQPGAERAKWEVTWLAKGQRFDKDFGDDIAGAIVLRDKLIAGGRRDVTLRSKNVAWPPPEDYRERTEIRYKVEVKTVTRKGRRVKKKFKVPYEVTIHKMKRANEVGIWWCPYCIKFRRFEKCDGFHHDGIWVPQSGMYCPSCGISHYNFAVRRWNPQADLLTFRRNASRRKPTTRRRRGR